MRLIALEDKFIVDMITSKVEKDEINVLQSITVFFSVVMMLTDKKLSKESKDSVLHTRTVLRYCDLSTVQYSTYTVL